MDANSRYHEMYKNFIKKFMSTKIIIQRCLEQNVYRRDYTHQVCAILL